jgi:hypothetical protein
MSIDELNKVQEIYSHLYLVEQPMLFLNLRRVHAVKLKKGPNDDWNLLDPYGFTEEEMKARLKTADLGAMTMWYTHDYVDYGDQVDKEAEAEMRDRGITIVDANGHDNVPVTEGNEEYHIASWTDIELLHAQMHSKDNE